MRLSKMNAASKRGNSITICSSYSSLIDMINQRGDEYPSNAPIDSSNHTNTFNDIKEIENLNKVYKLHYDLKLIKAGPGDRSCHLKKSPLCLQRYHFSGH